MRADKRPLSVRMSRRTVAVALDKAAEYAGTYFKELYEGRDENFGNARDVRNMFERAVARQADRVAALEHPGREELMALTTADLREEDGPQTKESNP